MTGTNILEWVGGLWSTKVERRVERRYEAVRPDWHWHLRCHVATRAVHLNSSKSTRQVIGDLLAASLNTPAAAPKYCSKLAELTACSNESVKTS